jgi:secondary thiamine-phosphate synthase enzyme
VWIQRSLMLSVFPRGFHLITDRVVAELPELRTVQVGLLHVFIQHTSASLTLNENADRDVRRDFEMATNRIVPETLPYVHTIEGADDMPAHIKASFLGSSVTIPVSKGSLNLGTWQGIYLGEHRNQATPRTLVLTLWGETSSNR